MNMAMRAEMSMQAVQGLPQYHSILLAVDSSDHSDRGIAEATALARLWNATITGAHVYAASMHDARFRQMEGGLPQRYRQEQALEHQREVHDDLITRGLSIISDAYLDQVERACARSHVRFVRRALEGKNYRELVNEANSGRYDLLVIGAIGLGATPGSRVGTVCERVVRRATADTLVIKDSDSLAAGPIVVAVDGSDWAYGGLLTALSLARHWRVPVKVVAAFDPYYHYIAFNRIAGVLSDEAAKVFRFREQERLHEEIIDDGLAKIYEGHLRVAQVIAEEHRLEIETALLDGKPHAAIAQYLAHADPSLLVVGRLGIHADPDLDIGGNAEKLLRDADCAVLLSQRRYRPPAQIVAETSIAWTPQAEQRMAAVPAFAQNVARLAVLRYAQERGHTMITERIVEAATATLCPHRARTPAANMSADAPPSSSQSDGVRWSRSALDALNAVSDLSVRDHLRLRAEKKARRLRSRVVRLSHLQGGNVCDNERQLQWEAAALARLMRVPAGPLRELVRQRVELFALRRHAAQITLDLVEAKYAEWAAGSAKQERTLPWDSAALERVNRIPDVVRGMVMKEIERCARDLGHARVTAEAIDKARCTWAENCSFHSEMHPGQYGGSQCPAGESEDTAAKAKPGPAIDDE